MTELPILYKADNNDAVRIWRAEISGDSYRIISGLRDGQHVESEWKRALPKNEGKANATTGEDQAIKEVEALYKKKREQSGYFDRVEDIYNETFFEAMLAEKFSDKKVIKALEEAFKKGIRVFSQPKFDGIRSVTKKTGMFSRNGKEHVAAPHVLGALQDVFNMNIRGFVLDGEMYNHALRDDFNQVQSLAMQKKPTADDLAKSAELVQLHIYDLFDPENPDRIFSERLKYLKWLEESQLLPDCIQFARTDEVFSFEDIDRLQGEYLEERYEGQMLRIDGPYENKRTRNLIKRKEFFDEEFKIVEVQEGEGNWQGCAKKVMCQKDDGTTFKAGVRGTQEQMAAKLAEKDDWIGSEVTVRYPNLTPDGIPRFGVVVAWWKGSRKEAE